MIWVWTKHSKAHLAHARVGDVYASAVCHNALGKLEGHYEGNSKAMVASSFVPNGFCRCCQRIEAKRGGTA